jgi:hypothetical protein
MDQTRRKLSGAERAAALAENVAIFVIVFAVLAAALATSFTHMHDWTVRALVATGLPHLDAASSSPYGWSNAVISELIPLAGLLAIRRRLVAGQSVVRSYPLGLVIVGTVISITAQLAWVSGGADGTVAASFLAILPAVAAGAMLKLGLSMMDSAREARNVEEAADRKRDAEAEEVRRIVAEAEAEARRLAEAEAEARAEAEAARGRERKALAEAEAARAERNQIRGIAEAEATRLEGSAGAEADARRDAEREAARLRAELDQTRVALAKTRDDLATATELLELDRAAAPISAPPDNVRRLPQHRPRPTAVEIPAEIPKIKDVGTQTAEQIAQVMRAMPGLAQKDIAARVGTSTRTVRNFVQGLAALSEQREEVNT